MSGRPRVLLVEDEALTAINMSRELAAMGYEVLRPAVTGAMALESAAVHHPDFVLMDINLPGGMDGVETARRLREREQGHARIIFMSGYADEHVEARARGIGATAFVAKPVDTAEIVRVMRGLDGNDGANGA